MRGSVNIAGGSESITNLANYKDPRAAYARNAIRMLDMLQGADGKSGIRAQLATGVKSDLIGRPVDPRTAIAMAEMGLADLDPKNLDGMKKEAAPAVKGVVRIPDGAIEQLSGPKINGVDHIYLKVREVGVEVEGGKTIPFEEFEKRNGPHNLTFSWLVFQSLGRTDASGDKIMYLLNPNNTGTSDRYSGVLVRNITLTSGETGDFVVKTRATEVSPSVGPEWEPVLNPDGKVDPSNVLFQTKQGTYGDPVLDNRFRKNYTEAQAGRVDDFFFLARHIANQDTSKSAAESSRILVSKTAISTVPYVICTMRPSSAKKEK